MKNRLRRLWLPLALLLMTTCAQAFDLQQLDAQLSEPAVVRGDFIQQKHLRALPQPLVSEGRFVLSRELGLLWLLQKPLQQDYRINDAGVALRNGEKWQPTGTQRAAAEYNKLFLAVLRGDSSALQQRFELQLSGTPDAWQLVLTPRSRLLQQIFTRILITGGATAEQVELFEAQGDSTSLSLKNLEIADELSAEERHDLIH
jgi:outer membrane lipoprotein-sorting protein